MADPLSIAGLGTGVISLGLQVVGGLYDYLNAIKGRTEELSLAKQHVANMKDSLLAIEGLLSEVKKTWPTSATSIERHLQSCDPEIRALDTLLSQLARSTSSRLGVRFGLAGQKLTYPFNRAHMHQLEERAAKVNSALQTALQITVLNASITARNQVQQVHEVLLAMSQPKTVQAQRTVDFLPLMAGESPEKIFKGGDRVPLDPIEAVVALASKPSLLSTSIETAAKRNALQSPRSEVPLACVCRSSRRISYYRKSWGYFLFTFTTSSTRRHLSGCPFSQIDTGETRSTIYTAEYCGLKKLLKATFILSFIDTYGAAGRNIGPSVTYYPIVSRHRSPTFRIMTLALRMVQRSSELNISEVASVLRRCYDNILILYSRGKGSAKDINSQGESIMHLIAAIIITMSLDVPNNRLLLDTTFMAATKLIACGVPLTAQGRDGDTACGRLMIQGNPKANITEFATLLIPSTPDVTLFQDDRRYGLAFPFIPGCAGFLSQNIRFAEASGCESLSLAVISGDERLVQGIIRRHPESIKEVDQFGHTPLHLAINRPSCLRLIMEATGSLLLLEHLSVHGQTPLESAWLNDCKESTQIFLASGSRIRSRYLHKVDNSCQKHVLIALKQRRWELKQLALDNLTWTEAEFLKLHENTTLDTNAFEVQGLLQDKGVNIPSRLFVEDERWFASVYHPVCVHGNITSIFDQLWVLGFHNIDSFNQPGELPMTRHRDLSVVRWLIEHGADYWTPFNERTESTGITEPLTPAHFIFANIGDQFNRVEEPAEFLRVQKWLVEKLLQVRVSDACGSCPCSPRGCTPVKGFLDRMIRTRSSQHASQLERSIWRCVYFIKAFRTCLYQDDLMLFVTRMTFDAMELGHTCCQITCPSWHYKGVDHTSEEIEEINSEQSALQNLFADLLDELEQVAFDDQNGTPLISSDPEEFWVRRWLPRITAILDGLNGDNLTTEEILSAEAIGVVWEPQSAHVTNCEDDMIAEYSPEWVMNEMQKIMNE